MGYCELNSDQAQNTEWCNNNINDADNGRQKPYQCSICKKKFSRLCTLTSHTQIIHNTRKPLSLKETQLNKNWACDKCEKRFNSLSSLNIHARIHSGIYPFICEVCKRCFSDPSNFNAHKRNVHGTKKLFKCDDCDKRFYERQLLTKHKRIHFSDKPYRCEICDKQFARKQFKSYHMKIHTGKKNYLCDKCGASFYRNADLTRHKLTHVEKKSFTCIICSNSYSRKDYFKSHLRKHLMKNIQVTSDNSLLINLERIFSYKKVLKPSKKCEDKLMNEMNILLRISKIPPKV